LEGKLRDLSREAYRLKNQQKESFVISAADSGVGTYYSNWTLTAIHTLSSIGKFQTADQIGKRLGLPVAVAQVFLNQLQTLEFVKKEGSHYKWSSGNLHLSDDSSWISNHHLNWRLRAIDNTQKNDRAAMHYTAIQSMSEDDFEVLKKKIANFIKEFNKVSDPSEPEEAFCFSLDFFKI
jgi:predicted oxidoreductase